MSFEYLHEVEVVSLYSNQKRPLKVLLSVFYEQGFTLDDDIVSLDRTDSVPPWQHSSIVEVECQLHGEEVFGFDEGDWDSLHLEYLFATLPFECAESFVSVVARTCKLLSIDPTFNGQITTCESLMRDFAIIREELMAVTGEDAGSEGLAIHIRSTYPR